MPHPDFSVICGNCLGRKDEPNPPGWACPYGHPPAPPLTPGQQQAARIAALEAALRQARIDLAWALGSMARQSLTIREIDALLGGVDAAMMTRIEQARRDRIAPPRIPDKWRSALERPNTGVPPEWDAPLTDDAEGQ